MSKEAIRISVFLESLGGGGAERFTQWLLTKLDRDRFQPSLLLLRGELEYSLPSDVHVDVLHQRPRHLQGPLLRAIAAGLDKQRPDVVVTPLMYPGQLLGRSLPFCSGSLRWIARLGSPTPPRRLIHKVGFWRFRRVISAADAVIQNTRGGADALRRQLPSVADRVAYIPNAAPDAATSQPATQAGPSVAEGPTVIWAGRLDRVKRPDLAVTAAAQALRRRPFRLKMFGDGPLKPELQAQIERLGVQGRVALCGRSNALLDEMRQAHLFFLTSDSEGMPNAMIEAMSVGLPVVATDCRFGPSEWVTRESGRLAKTGDAAGLADAITELLGDEDRRQEMGARAREQVLRQCRGDHLIEQWHSILSRQSAPATS